MFKRIFLLVLDSLGVGEAIDANVYQDNGANTLKHIMDNYDLFIPNLEKLGLVNTINMSDKEEPDAFYTIAKPTNVGKDSLTSHYELMGIRTVTPFKLFSEKAFPRELLEKIENVTGKRVIGNKVINGDQIINELGERHLSYGSLIIYTSNDSTLQVAAHEDVVPIPKLYQYCEKIRKITLDPEYRVARVIARPFTGKPGKFKFTQDRCDYAVKPPKKSVLNSLKDNGLSVISIGKINDIFDGEGITKIVKSSNNNMDTITKLTDIMSKKFNGLCFINLNDFDALYGHTRDLEGYAKAIEEFDVEIPLILNKLEPDDLLIITADHGNDPTFPGNSHTRENVPVIIYSRKFLNNKKLEPLKTMADIGATIADNFGVEKPEIGTSFLDKLSYRGYTSFSKYINGGFMYITILLIIYNLLFFYLFKHKKNLNNDYDKEKNKYNRLKTKKITRIINIGYISINLIYLLIVFLSINLDIIDNLLIYTVIFILYILIYLFIELNTKIYRTKLKIIDKKIINNKDILYIITSYILFIIEKISISYNLSKMNTNEYNFINIFNIILYLVCTILILILITYLIIYVFRNKSYFVYSNIDENYLQDIRFYKKIEFKKIANHIIYITAFIVFYYIRIPFIYFFYIIVIISILYYIYNKINMIKKESSRVYKSITIAKNKPGVVYAFLFSKDLLLLRKIIIFEIMLFVSTIVYYGLGEGEFIIAAISIYLILLYTIIEDKIYLIRYLSSLNEEFINVDEYSIIENKKINYIETINLFGINLYRLIIVDTINYESNIIIYDPELVIEDIEIRINKSNIDDYIMLETYLYEE